MSRSTRDDPIWDARDAIAGVRRSLETLDKQLLALDDTASLLHEARRVLIMFGSDEVLEDINAKTYKAFEQLKK